MHPVHHARTDPDKPAFIMAGTGESVTYGQLDARSNQGAHLFRSIGLVPGDTIALFLENSPRYFEIAWAAQRAGLYFTCISSRLTGPEVAYILHDCGAKAVLFGASLAATTRTVAQDAPGVAFWSVDGDVTGFDRFETLRAPMPSTPIADEMAGTDMLYSSGTTGRPKGIKTLVPPGTPIDQDNALRQIASLLGQMMPDSVYLSPAPLYHAAPLRWCMTAMKIGCTVVIMEKFDPEAYLAAVETYCATHTQVVPTMFVRMLKLPEAARNRHDVSSLKFVIHAAAPCPVEIKSAMIDWWGPVIYEYYAGSEGNGLTWIGPEDWLAHKGSVGKAMLGKLRICDEAGEELAPGETGTVYFSDGPLFEYHNDPAKTAGSRHPAHPDWSTLGDIGQIDAEGYLYLTDRKAFMIISGGVNVYPQEAEDVLITHPRVADVAVIGVPDEDFGEAVKAVVQPLDWSEAGPDLAAELIALCQSRLSRIKCPRSIDFERELPRHPTGKLYKRLIRDRYWGKTGSTIV
jgi:acyl-CoA synthetase (AMP-forming)/AMP-acid ligase II